MYDYSIKEDQNRDTVVGLSSLVVSIMVALLTVVKASPEGLFGLEYVDKKGKRISNTNIRSILHRAIVFVVSLFYALREDLIMKKIIIIAVMLIVDLLGFLHMSDGRSLLDKLLGMRLVVKKKEEKNEA